MKFLIVGRTATGKDTLASLLTYKYGWTFVKSMTTRPKRYAEEDTHEFVSAAYAKSIPISDKVAFTEINGYEYFATREQVKSADAYIIDPNGVKVLLEKMPEENFIIVYLIPKDKYTQRLKAIGRGENKDVESEIFESRYDSEDAQFTEFETLLDTYGIHQYKNVSDVIRFINFYDSDNMAYFAHSLNIIKQIAYK